MDRSPVTVPAVAVHGMLAGCRTRLGEAGLVELLGQAGIVPALLDEPGARVLGAQYVDLLRTLIARLDDEALGLLSRPLRPGSLALVMRSAIGAPTLAEALHRLARALTLLQDDLHFSRADEGPLCGLVITPRQPAAAVANFLQEYLVRISWRLLVWLHGGRLRARGFDFLHPAPAYAAQLARLFPGTLRFGQPQAAVWFDRAALAAPVRRDEAALREFLASSLAHLMLPRPRQQACSTRLRTALQQARPDWLGLAEAARRLHLAPSTLQRHLAAEGHSFQAVKDELRRDLAIARLSRERVPLATLAAELGFADSAAFQRAFKGWTGSGPGRYRRPAP